jgi:hypothetical protein
MLAYLTETLRDFGLRAGCPSMRYRPAPPTRRKGLQPSGCDPHLGADLSSQEDGPRGAACKRDAILQNEAKQVFWNQKNNDNLSEKRSQSEAGHVLENTGRTGKTKPTVLAPFALGRLREALRAVLPLAVERNNSGRTSCRCMKVKINLRCGTGNAEAETLILWVTGGFPAFRWPCYTALRGAQGL